jgi:hypothetical protein
MVYKKTASVRYYIGIVEEEEEEEERDVEVKVQMFICCFGLLRAPVEPLIILARATTIAGL